MPVQVDWIRQMWYGTLWPVQSGNPEAQPDVYLPGSACDTTSAVPSADRGRHEAPSSVMFVDSG